MTNPPSGGSATQTTSESSGASTPASSDFGATTLSGRSAAQDRSTDGSSDGHAGRAPEARGSEARGPVPAPPGVPPAGLPTGPQERAVPTGPEAIRGIRAGRNRGPRRARLQIRHINPVTVLKFSCVLSIALFFVWLIVIGVLFGILDAAGVINNINDTITQLNGAGSKPPITGGVVFGGAAIIGVVNIVLFIALTTIGAVVYNLCADLVGGIEITLSER